MNIDFTLKKYRKLCNTIANSEYTPLTVKKYLSLKNGPEKIIIIRHGVDKYPVRALKMAILEEKFGVSSSYYFRMIPDIFQVHIIKAIAELGHEIGYHYEVLDKAGGNIAKAIALFKEELAEFRQICNVKTVSPHGNPISPKYNEDIWNECDYREFSLIGDACISINFNKVIYISDTGRSWHPTRYKIKDAIDANISNTLGVKSTDDIIELIKSQNVDQILLGIHPQRWADKPGEWLKELIWQNIKNVGKFVIKKYNSSFLLRSSKRCKPTDKTLSH